MLCLKLKVRMQKTLWCHRLIYSSSIHRRIERVQFVEVTLPRHSLDFINPESSVVLKYHRYVNCSLVYQGKYLNPVSMANKRQAENGGTETKSNCQSYFLVIVKCSAFNVSKQTYYVGIRDCSFLILILPLSVSVGNCRNTYWCTVCPLMLHLLF